MNNYIGKPIEDFRRGDQIDCVCGLSLILDIDLKDEETDIATPKYKEDKLDGYEERTISIRPPYACQAASGRYGIRWTGKSVDAQELNNDDLFNAAVDAGFFEKVKKKE